MKLRSHRLLECRLLISNYCPAGIEIGQCRKTMHALCRGMGRQAQLVICNIVGFWIIGTLTGWSLAFPAHLGVSGLWIGIIAGVCACGKPQGKTSIQTDHAKSRYHCVRQRYESPGSPEVHSIVIESCHCLVLARI